MACSCCSVRSASRMSRWVQALAFVIGIILGVLAVRRRSLEYAAALHVGQSKDAQLLGVALETLVWAGLGTLGALGVLTMLCARWSVDDGFAVWLGAARTPLALMAGILLAALATCLTVKESQLFRLFKNR